MTYNYTETEYEALVAAVVRQWTPVSYAAALRPLPRAVIWRHDVDYSPHRALALARIERRYGLRSTYFFLPHAEYYNLLEKDIADKVTAIAALGHDIGLHLDMGFYEGRVHSAADALHVMAQEKSMLEFQLQVPVESFSFHNPTLLETLEGFDLQADTLAGMRNAGGRAIGDRYLYASDSRGGWRRRDLPAIVAEGSETHLHVLTHPGRWTPEPLPDASYLLRACDGRCAALRQRLQQVAAYWDGPIDEKSDKETLRTIYRLDTPKQHTLNGVQDPPP